MMLDFTLGKYKELCSTILDSGFTILTVASYLNSTGNKVKQVVLRHDVDRNHNNALKMAKLEAELGIQSTYYFRYPYTFKPAVIKKILNYGHEIGYHYETLHKARGNCERAKDLFVSELGEFKKISIVKTVCSHGNALSKYDNRNMWNFYKLSDLGLSGEAYLSFASHDLVYFSDTGRSWSNKNNIRDYIPNCVNNSEAQTTDDLISLIKRHNGTVLYITTHPERWAANYLDLFLSTIKDTTFNVLKRVKLEMRF